MSSSKSCIGIEVDTSVIRASILDEEATRVIGYAELKRSNVDSDNADKLTTELKALWAKLPDKLINDAKVAVTFGVQNSGVISNTDSGAWIDALEIKTGQTISRVSHNDSISYAPLDSIRQIRDAFADNQIPLTRLELAANAAARSLDNNIDCRFSVGSGYWWTATVRDGEVTEAKQKDVASDDRSLYLQLLGEDEEIQLEDISDVEISDMLVESFDIARASLAVSVGAAKGLQSEEASFSSNLEPLSTIADLDPGGLLGEIWDLSTDSARDENNNPIKDFSTDDAPSQVVESAQPYQLAQAQAGVVEVEKDIVATTVVDIVEETPTVEPSTVEKIDLVQITETELDSVDDAAEIKKKPRKFWSRLVKFITLLLLVAMSFLSGLGIYHITETDYDWFGLREIISDLE